MNKITFTALFLFLVALPLASAMPMIQNVYVQPSNNLWLGENANMFLNCYDDQNKTIQAYANITGPNGLDLTPNGPFNFNCAGNSCSYLIDSIYLDRTGLYNAIIACTNEDNESNYTYASFTVSKLTGFVNPIIPNPTYYQGVIEIDFIVQKNDDKISSNVNFNVWLDNNLISLRASPTYDDIRGWILKIGSPSSSGIHNIKITAFYDRTNATAYSSIDYIDFGIGSVYPSEIQSNDNFTVNIKASEGNKAIDFGPIRNNLSFIINSASVPINNIIPKSDNSFDAFVTAPTLPPGIYPLQVYLNYNGNYYSDNTTLYYTIPFSGTIVDDNNKAVSTQIKFIKGGSTQSCGTDSYGYYSDSSCGIYLVPDYYDVGISFPNSVVYLSSVYINSFDDPLKYFYYDDFDVPGIRNAGLHDFEIDLPYSNMQIEMSYNVKNVLNENDLRIFECSDWNRGKKACNSNWDEVDGVIDTVRNKAKLNSTINGPLSSAFLIGEIKSINVDFSLDKNEYSLDDKVRITGLVKDENGNNVGNTTIQAKVKNTQIVSSIVTDENGVFSFDIPTPRSEGDYDLVLKAVNRPYNDFNGDKKFVVVKSRSVLIDFPDTIKIARGENITQNLSLLNTGQADIDSLRVYFEGIPENYYKFSENISLKSGEQKTLFIDFNIPFYADVGVSSATLKIEGDNISQEKVFGLSIFEKSENTTEKSPTTGLVTGFTLPEINYLDIISIILFAVVCFSVAIILKKGRIRKDNKEKIKNTLFNIKNFIGIEDSVAVEGRTQSSNPYDKLILTEFPNFLELSKKLINNKFMGEDDGKDN